MSNFFVLLGSSEWRWRGSTMMACTPWDQNAVCMLCVVHMVIFDHLAGLCLRGQHRFVSSVGAEYQSHSQRIWCEDITSSHRCPGWDFPLPAGQAHGFLGHVALYLCLLATISRSAVCTVLTLFMLNKCFLQPLCCGNFFCWIQKSGGVLV